MARKVALLAIQTALAWVFLKAGAGKIWDFAHWHSATPDFTLAIQHYRIVPWPDLTVLMAIYLPWLEAVAALALLTRKLRMGACLALTTLTAVFIGALGSAWARGLQIDCGCFGKDEITTDFRGMILRDILILAGLSVVFVQECRRLQKSCGSHQGSRQG